MPSYSSPTCPDPYVYQLAYYDEGPYARMRIERVGTVLWGALVDARALARATDALVEVARRTRTVLEAPGGSRLGCGRRIGVAFGVVEQLFLVHPDGRLEPCRA